MVAIDVDDGAAVAQEKPDTNMLQQGGVVARNPSGNYPPIRPYMADYMGQMRAKADALRLKPLRDKAISRLSQAMALSLRYPENFEQIASDANIDEAVLDDALDKPEGLKMAHNMLGQMRANGDLERVKTTRLRQSLIDLIDRSVSEGTMEPGLAPKVVEIVSKMSDGRQGVTEPTLPLTRFKGTGAELVEAITAWVEHQRWLLADFNP